MIKEIIEGKDGGTLAIVTWGRLAGPGIDFVTPPEESLQVGLMLRERGYKVARHEHSRKKREIWSSGEFLYVIYGRVIVDVYDDDLNQTHIKPVHLLAGDSITLLRGGHGLEMTEDTEIIEVKQGPYVGEDNKVYF